MEKSVISKIGAYHMLNGMELSDKVKGEWADENKSVYICCVADGSSSARMAPIGAEVCVENAVEFYKNNYSYELFDEYQCDVFLGYLNYKLRLEAKKYGCAITDFGTTATVVILDFQTNSLCYVSLGTETVFKITESGIRMLVGSPDENSVTDNKFISFGRHNLQDVLAVVIMTDGIFRNCYKAGEIIEPYKTYILQEDIISLTERMHDTMYMDDATLVHIHLKY